MDLEQRIGRIHRYGQAHTAQVYNVVSADTIEGQIYLLLEEKLLQIAKTLGKVDELGQIAEDLRGQILGQLSERISYDKLYQDAVRDPKLVRTRQELEVAIENAQTARHVVWELFQDLDGFVLDDYKQMDDAGAGMARLVRYVRESVALKGCSCRTIDDQTFEVAGLTELPVRFTQNREFAKGNEEISLLGLEHPLVRRLLDDDRALPGSERGLTAAGDQAISTKGLLTIWRVVLQDKEERTVQRVVAVGLDEAKQRSRVIETSVKSISSLRPSNEGLLGDQQRKDLLSLVLPEILRRDLAHKGQLSDSVTMSSRLLAWIELLPALSIS
ncbi:MAG: helicase [Bryobacteraceae bacterium]